MTYTTLTDARRVVGEQAEAQVSPEQFDGVVATVARQVFDNQIEDGDEIQRLIEEAANA